MGANPSLCQCLISNHGLTEAQFSRIHALITEEATDVVKARALEAIKKNDPILVDRSLEEIGPYENLLEIGANYTFLHAIAEYNSFNVVEQILSWTKLNMNTYYKEAINIQDKQFNTPAMVCALHNSPEVLYFLLKNGDVDLEITDFAGKNLYKLCKKHSINCLIVLEKFSNPEKNISAKDLITLPIVLDNVNPLLKNDAVVNATQEVIDRVNQRITKAQVLVSIDDIKRTAFQFLQNNNKFAGIPPNSKVHAILSNLKDSDTFYDAEFLQNIKSLCRDNSHPDYSTFLNTEWKRPHEICNCEIEEIKIFQDIDPYDVQRGFLGKCDFLHALSAISEFPIRLMNLFVNTDSNKFGVYGIRFFLQGVPEEIIIDDYFPQVSEGKVQKFKNMFSANREREIWVQLIEKAWAKLFGTYVNSQQVDIDNCFEYLLGCPAMNYDCNVQVEKELWNTIIEANRKNFTISAMTKDEDYIIDFGLVPNQSYNIISVHQLGEYKIFKIRNPWDKTEWTGDFGDDSQLWTPEFKKKIGYKKEDGIFCMDIKDFQRLFQTYTIGLYRLGWEYTYVKSGPQSVDITNYFKLNVIQDTDLYLRVHFRDKLLANDPDYSYPQTEFIVVKVTESGYTNLVPDPRDLDGKSCFGSKTIYPTKNLKMRLIKGQYIIRVSPQWKNNSVGEFTLSAYSDQRVELSSIDGPANFLARLYESAGNESQRKKFAGNDCQIAYEFNGHNAYVWAKNDGKKTWHLDINFTSLNNMKIAKNTKLKDRIKLAIAPGKTEVSYIKRIDYSLSCDFTWIIMQEWK